MRILKICLTPNTSRWIKAHFKFVLVVSAIFIFSGMVVSNTPAQAPPFNEELVKNADYQGYLEFFQEVYKTISENYYHPAEKDDFRKFLYVFNTKFYPQFKLRGASQDFIKWRSSAYLVDAVKAEEDIFSAFYPPREAKEYEQTVLGKRIDLGIEGELTRKGYKVTRLQIRADAYEKGLREEDILIAINRKSVKKLSEEKIRELLRPLEGEEVTLKYIDAKDRKKKVIKVISKEYFKQFVFMLPVDVPGVYCLQIERFNRKTGEDMERFIKYILGQGETSLIVDLRGNPGGPPLAAREISSFFLPPNEEFAYFQKRGKPKASLDIPEIPENFHYKGDMVILVNEKSGSASELFTGILQRRGRAVVMGTNTAGQVFLKSMFPFEDGSMLLLVTARGYHPDGHVFSFDGVAPDERIEDQAFDLIQHAAEYLASRR